jgi:hypothetical protein
MQHSCPKQLSFKFPLTTGSHCPWLWHFCFRLHCAVWVVWPGMTHDAVQPDLPYCTQWHLMLSPSILSASAKQHFSSRYSFWVCMLKTYSTVTKTSFWWATCFLLCPFYTSLTLLTEMQPLDPSLCTASTHVPTQSPQNRWTSC